MKNGKARRRRRIESAEKELEHDLSKIQARTDEKSVRERFRKVAQHSATIVGSAWSFLLAVVVVLVWGITGPIFHYSDTWQLVINTGTTIVTFLMVFLIQNTQNRDSRAIQIKLDELLRAITGARTGLVDLEDATDEELEHLQHEFERLRKKRSKSSNHDART